MKRNYFGLTAVAAAAMVVHAPASATNGYFLPGSGYRSQGMGGVGIAYGRDSLSANANPANIVNTGMRGDLGFGVFNPERYAATGAATGVTNPNGNPAQAGYGFDLASESDSRYFIVPEMGFTMPLTESVHVGLAVVGNGGMNTSYPENFFSFNAAIPAQPGNDQKLGVDMMQLLMPISAAIKVNEDHALGASLVLAETRFRAYGLEAFQYFDGQGFTITSDPSRITGQGFDYSYGAGVRFGWLGEFVDDKVTLGLVYTSRTYMTKLDKYRGLFAEQGDFDIPENYGLGVAIKPMKNLIIAADVMRINYSDIASVGNRGPGASVTPYNLTNQINGVPSILDASKELGKDGGMGFGWEDQTVYKVGIQYGVNKRLLVRAGYNHGDSPIPDDQLTFNTLAPAVVEDHYSVGFTYRHGEELEITGTYMYVASNDQCSPPRQNIVGSACVNMHQNVLGITFGWVLDPGPIALDEFGDGDWAGINFDGWYGGFGFGQSKYRDVQAASANTRAEGWRVYGGYQLNKYFGLEGAYANLNDMTGNAGAIRTEIDADAWTLDAVLSYPLTAKLAVAGKVGAAYMLSETATKNGAALTVRAGEDGFEPHYGLGVRYALLDNVDVRADWERFDAEDFDVDLLSAGLAVKF